MENTSNGPDPPLLLHLVTVYPTQLCITIHHRGLLCAREALKGNVIILTCHTTYVMLLTLLSSGRKTLLGWK